MFAIVAIRVSQLKQRTTMMAMQPGRLDPGSIGATSTGIGDRSSDLTLVGTSSCGGDGSEVLTFRLKVNGVKPWVGKKSRHAEATSG